MKVPKNYAEFKETLSSQNPPDNWPEGLRALWFDANGDWHGAHNIAQEMHNSLGSWIHAYLHRKEGDKFNAGYWYRKAGRPFSKLSLKEEHEEIVAFVLVTQ